MHRDVVVRIEPAVDRLLEEAKRRRISPATAKLSLRWNVMCPSKDVSATVASMARASAGRPSIPSSSATSCTVYGICGTRDCIHCACSRASAAGRAARRYIRATSG